jgi:outer membrane receptor protein involved in Fe transport
LPRTTPACLARRPILHRRRGHRDHRRRPRAELAALDVELGAKTLVDLEGRFEPTRRIRLAIGAENLFNVYPDAFPITRNTTRNTPFSNYAPFGR